MAVARLDHRAMTSVDDPARTALLRRRGGVVVVLVYYAAREVRDIFFLAH